MQGGTSLYKVDLTSGVATTLTLPTDVTLSTTRKPKFAVLNQWVVMTNSPTRNLAIDPEGTVRVLVPRPPSHGPTVAASGSGFTGDFQFAVSFIVTNSDGELLMESPLGPSSAVFAATDDAFLLTDIATSLDNISARRVYRTLTDGTAFFHLLDHEGNVSETLLNSTPDATLTLLPALPSLVSPPGTLPGVRFKNIVEWKSRLWAVADLPDLLDTVYISETNKVYAWPNTITAYPTGQDSQGIVGFAARRNQLGLLKRNGLWQISGSSSGTGISVTNLAVSQIAFGKAGSLSAASIVTINDRVYWLGNDGVYEWSDEGVRSITDDSVAPWFKTDTYFERSRFPNAFGKYNELRNSYDLHLAAVDASTENRWVSFNLTNRKWYGPHLTSAFTPSHAAHLTDENGIPVVLVGGSDGIVYVGNQTTFRDGSATAISFDVDGPYHFANAPDIHHLWSDLSILTKIEAAGTLSITPSVGRLNASAGPVISHDLTLGRERLRTLGVGPGCQLNFSQATVNQGVSILGYELPVTEVGRR